MLTDDQVEVSLCRVDKVASQFLAGLKRRTWKSVASTRSQTGLRPADNAGQSFAGWSRGVPLSSSAVVPASGEDVPAQSGAGLGVEDWKRPFGFRPGFGRAGAS